MEYIYQSSILPSCVSFFYNLWKLGSDLCSARYRRHNTGAHKILKSRGL